MVAPTAGPMAARRRSRVVASRRMPAPRSCRWGPSCPPRPRTEVTVSGEQAPGPPERTDVGDEGEGEGEVDSAVREEEQLLARVQESLAERAGARQRAEQTYDQELVSLRDEIGEARLEDVP